MLGSARSHRDLIDCQVDAMIETCTAEKKLYISSIKQFVKVSRRNLAIGTIELM